MEEPALTENQQQVAVNFLVEDCISWQCKKQTIMEFYYEAEYVAVLTVRGKYYGLKNQNDGICHIEIRFHFIRDCYEKRLIEVIKIHTNSNVADLLTKGFDVIRFNFLVETAVLSTTEEGLQVISATIDGHEKIITEDSLRRHLKLDDASKKPAWVNSVAYLATASSVSYKEETLDEEQLNHLKVSTSSPSLSPQPTLPSPSPELIQPTHEAEETASMPHDSPLHVVHSHGSAEGSVQQHDLTGRKISQINEDPTVSLVQDEGIYWIPQEEEVHEKPSDETEVLVQEETPTEIIEEHGSGEKGEMEISTANIQVSTASPPKVSTVVPHVYTRRSAKDKGNAIMEELATPNKVKKRTQVQLSIDEELARVLRYHALKNKPVSIAQARRNMITYLKTQGGYKESYFKKMSYNDIRPIFERVWDYVNTFISIGSEVGKDSSKPSERETSKTVEEEKVEKEDVNPEPVLIEKKAVGIRRKTLARRRASDKQGQDSSKRQKKEKETADYEEEKDELRMWLTVVPDEEEFVDPKILHTKFPIVD
ncbi:hypothetical protein Tco_0610124 [Tanacetum coccineum]